MKTSTARRWGTAVAGAIALGLAGTTAAQAAPAQSASGDVTSGPNHITYDAHRAADAPATAATGTFTADTTAGPLALLHLEGPVTCLDVRGDRMGLFYPIDSSKPSVFARFPLGIFISVTSDGAGHAKQLQFLPVPFRTTSSCAPLPALLPATGPATQSS